MEKPAEIELAGKSKLVAKTKHYKPVFSHLQRFLFQDPRFFFVATSPTLPHVTTPRRHQSMPGQCRAKLFCAEDHA
jgi:hypothetical protein